MLGGPFTAFTDATRLPFDVNGDGIGDWMSLWADGAWTLSTGGPAGGPWLTVETPGGADAVPVWEDGLGALLVSNRDVELVVLGPANPVGLAD